MPNIYDLARKAAIVTGGANGIGRAISERLLASGADVWVWDTKPIQISGVKSSVVDISRADQIANCLSQLPDNTHIDILVNDAGYLGLARPFQHHEVDDWMHIVRVNLIGTMQVTQAVLPYMLQQGAGRIINLASLARKEGLPNLAAYSAASAGIIAFTKALSREVVERGVFVNCIAPGPIDTDMIRDLGVDAVDRMVSDSPMKRLGEPDEVAYLVAWLCSEASRFNTGAVFDMSGGRARY
jgi:2-dehydro-3-deoxy-L-rhamnonate dehydrogenase (NAD+)